MTNSTELLRVLMTEVLARLLERFVKEMTLENVEPVHEVVGVCGHRSLTCYKLGQSYKLGQRIQVFL